MNLGKMTIDRDNLSSTMFIVFMFGWLAVQEITDNLWAGIPYVLCLLPLSYFLNSRTYQGKVENHEGNGILQVRRRSLPFMVMRIHLEGYGILPQDKEVWDLKIREELIGKSVFVREDRGINQGVVEKTGWITSRRIPDAEVYPLRPLFADPEPFVEEPRPLPEKLIPSSAKSPST